MEIILSGSFFLYAFVDLALAVVSVLVVFRAYRARQIMKGQLVAAVIFVLMFFIAPLIFLAAMYWQRSEAPPQVPPMLK